MQYFINYQHFHSNNLHCIGQFYAKKMIIGTWLCKYKEKERQYKCSITTVCLSFKEKKKNENVFKKRYTNRLFSRVR